VSRVATSIGPIPASRAALSSWLIKPPVTSQIPVHVSRLVEPEIENLIGMFRADTINVL
jgi:hypothetical protein